MGDIMKNATLKAIVDAAIAELMIKTTGEQIYLNDKTTLSAKMAEMVAAINLRAKKTDVDEKLNTKANTKDLGALASKDKVSKSDLDTALATELDAKASKTAVDKQVSELETSTGNKLTEVNKAIDLRPTTAAVTEMIAALKQEIMGDLPVEAYDTFTELAAYVKEHEDVTEALTSAIGNKADKSVVDDILKVINGLGALATKDKVSKSDLDTALATELDAKANTDDVDSKLSDKSDADHKHKTSDITDFPTLGSASSKNVATSGNASADQVVMGNDSRLTDARKASDVHDWAKAETKPTYSKSEIGLDKVENVKAVSTEADQNLTDDEKAAARANIGAGESSFSGSYNDLTNIPFQWYPDIVSAKDVYLSDLQYHVTQINLDSSKLTADVDGSIPLFILVRLITMDNPTGAIDDFSCDTRLRILIDNSTGNPHDLQLNLCKEKNSIYFCDGDIALLKIVDFEHPAETITVLPQASDPLRYSAIHIGWPIEGSTLEVESMGDYTQYSQDIAISTNVPLTSKSGSLMGKQFIITFGDGFTLPDTYDPDNNSVLLFRAYSSSDRETKKIKCFTAEVRNLKPSFHAEKGECHYFVHTGKYLEWFGKLFGPATMPFVGATADKAGSTGYLPAPAAGDQNKFFRGDGTWATPEGDSSSGSSGSGPVAYATCNTTGATAAKVATISNDANWELAVGAEVIVKFNVDNAVTNCTLNVNGTGAKPIWYGAAVYTGLDGLVCGMIGLHIRYIYNGTYWVWMGSGYDANEWTAFRGATASAAGRGGYLPTPAAGSQDKFFKADGTWAIPTDTNNLGVATCETAANVAAKVVTITDNDNWKLAVGSEIIVKFTNTNTADHVSLNVNGTGAKRIWYNSSEATGTSPLYGGYANRYIHYVYNGTYWVWIGQSSDMNTWTALKGATTSAKGTAGYAPAPSAGATNRYLRSDATWSTVPDSNTSAYGTCSTAAATAEKAVSISNNDDWELKVGSEIIVKFGITNTASKVTLNVNNSGAKSIWYDTAAYTGNEALICGQENLHIRYVYNGTYWVWMGCGVGGSSDVMSATNPIGTGSFSLNRKNGSTVGDCSFAEGYNTQATGTYSHAEGNDTSASGENSHAEGTYTRATVAQSHAEGYGTTASGRCSHAQGSGTKASGYASSASGTYTTAAGLSQFVVGYGNDNQSDSIFEVGNGLISNGTTPANNGIVPTTKQNAFRVNQAGQAIAQTGLGIGKTVITEVQLRNAFCLDEAMRITGTLFMQHSTSVETNAYNAAGVVALATDPIVTDGITKAAAGYGFHNAGYDGAFLFLNPVDRYFESIDDIGNRNMRLAGDEVLLKATKEVKCYGTSLDINSPDGSSWASVRASAFSQQSSTKYKKNISDMTEEDALKLLQLRPVEYDYINELNGIGCYGLIAEEVNEIIPYPVVYDADGNPDGIDYSKFVPLIIKLSQIQEDRIDKLEKENADLKARLDKLEKLLTK